MSIALLRHMDLPTESLRSKSWDEFAQANAPKLDFIVTVCDNAAGEVCPIWPGHPLTAHWGVEDPAAVNGSEEQKRAAFEAAYRELESRIRSFLALPLATLDTAQLKERLAEIGRAHAGAA